MKDIAIEVMTPIQRDLNVEIKGLKKILDECTSVVKEHQLRHYSLEKALNGIQQTLLKELKNSDCDKTALKYELNRM